MKRHLDHGVRVALGSDVGAGTSLSLFSEGHFAYLAHMLRPGITLAAVLRGGAWPEAKLGAILTLARDASVHEVGAAGAIAASRAVGQPQ